MIQVTGDNHFRSDYHLSQFILALAITVFLLCRLPSRRDSQLIWLSGFFALVTVFIGLPLPILFNPNATPSANPWMRGAVSGQGEPLHVLPNVLYSALQTGC